MKEKKKIGIIGGGQLAEMLIPKLKEQDLEVYVLDSEDCPARDLCDHLVVGSVLSSEDIHRLSEQVDFLSYELENIHLDALKKLESKKQIFPSPQVLAIIQDKCEQKKFLKHHNFPTSDFYESKEPQDFPIVQKLKRGGYDGKGVSVLKSEKDWPSSLKGESFFEDCVDIKKEISVLAVRDQKGKIQNYEPVEMVFNEELNLLDYLVAPASISSSLKEQLIQITHDLIEKLNCVGLLAVEFFIDQKDRIFVNEMAPRPHNSGHHTIEACYDSQFSALAKVFSEAEINCQIVKDGFWGMFNLIGEAGFEGAPKLIGTDLIKDDEVFIHMYNKTKTMPGRKMGHVTVFHHDREHLNLSIQEAKKCLKVQSQL